MDELNKKSDECDKWKQLNIDLGKGLEMMKKKNQEMETQMREEMDWRRMYGDLRTRVEE